MKICHVITRMILGELKENTLLTLKALKKLTYMGIHLAYGPWIRWRKSGCRCRKVRIHLHHYPVFYDEPFILGQIFRAYVVHFGNCFYQIQRFDLVHTHVQKRAFWDAFAARETLASQPVLHTIHEELAFDEYISWKSFLFVRPERSPTHCDAIISVCETMKKHCH